MAEDAGEIIVKGGSVELNYDDSVFVKDPTKPRQHNNGNRKLTQIVVTDEKGAIRYDSGEDNSGLLWKVTAKTK